MLVFRTTEQRPKDLADITDDIVVIKGSSQAETMLAKQQQQPSLRLLLNETDDATELLQQVGGWQNSIYCGRLAFTGH